MKLHLLTIFATMAVLVLLVLPPPANAQGEGESASEQPPQQPEPTSPPCAKPGPFRPESFKPFPLLRPSRSNPFNLTGNLIGRPFRPFSIPFFNPFSITGNFTGRRLPSFFRPRNLTGRPIYKSVDSDDNVRPRVKAPLVREPRGVSF